MCLFKADTTVPLTQTHCFLRSTKQIIGPDFSLGLQCGSGLLIHALTGSLKLIKINSEGNVYFFLELLKKSSVPRTSCGLTVLFKNFLNCLTKYLKG